MGAIYLVLDAENAMVQVKSARRIVIGDQVPARAHDGLKLTRDILEERRGASRLCGQQVVVFCNFTKDRVLRKVW